MSVGTVGEILGRVVRAKGRTDREQMGQGLVKFSTRILAAYGIWPYDIVPDNDIAF